MTATGHDFPLALHADRLFPRRPGVRAIARELYEAVRELPLICPHGHVDPRRLASDEPFHDPASLLVTSDHYVTRLLHAGGVALDALGIGRARCPRTRARSIWRLLCEHWDVYRGTAVRYWLESQLVGPVRRHPRVRRCRRRMRSTTRSSPASARTRSGRGRSTPASASRCSRRPTTRATTSPLTGRSPTTRPGGKGDPTFRPDRLLEAGQSGWRRGVRRARRGVRHRHRRLRRVHRGPEQRRRFFIAHGATAADHGHADARTDPLDPADASRIYRAALADGATAAEAVAFRRHMVLEMARMSCEDGLVTTIHPGVVRGHHGPTAARFGPDTGHDVPVSIEPTNALRPLLERFGTASGFHLVVFTVDETLWSRELAPLAGFYPSVFAGAPWWFLSTRPTRSGGSGLRSARPPDSRALRASSTTRARVLHDPGAARHGVAQIDAGVLAQLVAEHRLTLDEAFDTAVDLVSTRPKVAFKL